MAQQYTEWTEMYTILHNLSQAGQIFVFEYDKLAHGDLWEKRRNNEMVYWT